MGWWHRWEQGRARQPAAHGETGQRRWVEQDGGVAREDDVVGFYIIQNFSGQIIHFLINLKKNL
jgi:hypothetical protein